MTGERERIAAQGRRQAADPSVLRRYDLSNPGVLYALQSNERQLLDALRVQGVLPLHDKRILDVGCGSGALLLGLARFGGALRSSFGIDINEPLLRRSHARSPGLYLAVADASELPFPNASFDLVTQFTAVTSMLDTNMRIRAASEMRRVVRPTGAIVWYDFFLPSPWSATRPLRLAEVRMLFPSCRLDVRRVTLLPPLARVVARSSWELALLLDRLPVLRSHYLIVIRPIVTTP